MAMTAWSANVRAGRSVGREWSHFATTDEDHANGLTFAKQRRGQSRPLPRDLLDRLGIRVLSVDLGR